MKISIITATYNSLAHLSDVTGSIQQQTFPNIEYIVIDGDSSDGTVDYFNRSKLVTRLISEPDKGIYDALNKGVQLSTGDIIGFLHSDDLFASVQTLKNIALVFATVSPLTGRKPDVVYGDLVFVDHQNTNKIVRYWKSKRYEPCLLYQGWMPPHPTIFMRREVYEKHGPFNINLKCAADYDYILRVFQDQTLTITYLPEVITKMRIGGVSTSGIKNLINKKLEDYWVLKNNKLPYPLWTLFAKSIYKIPQLIFRKLNVWINTDTIEKLRN
jgi:glycosyltransferase